MSHTTTIRSVPIRDISALQAAVDELKVSGVNCTLVENAKPRMYYRDQHGVCDYVLQLHDAKYDVGFTKQEDGTYAPVLDLWNNEIQGQIGATCPMPNTQEGKTQAAIGKLMQGYSKHAAINVARAQGYSVEDCVIDAENNVHLTLTTY